MRQNRVVAHAHIRTIIVNSERPEALVAFWSDILGVEVAERDDEASIVWLAPDSEGGVNLGFQRVAAKLATHTEVHVDVSVDDLDATERTVIELGGALVKRNMLASGFQWRVMADPDGNEFCIFRG